jgi:putative solute:sodium symporter small subunit
VRTSIRIERCRGEAVRALRRLRFANPTGGDVMATGNGADEARRAEYWRRTVTVTAVLLAIWFVVTYVVAFFAVPLNEFKFFGFPFAFYMGAQGSLVIYLVIIAFYARYMNKLDREFGVSEED